MSINIIKNPEFLSVSQKDQLEKIFFETSHTTSFNTQEEKQNFYQRWLGQYLEMFPEFCYFAIESNNLLGYVICCPDTIQFADNLKISSMEIFREEWEGYNAHLHINLGSEAQGKGIGSQLIGQLVGDLQQLGVKGLHIITGPDDRNVKFYHKNGFCFEKIGFLRNVKLLFMGKKL